MAIIKSRIDDGFDDRGRDIVTWGPKFATGVKVIDEQHRELVSLTNELYRACLSGNETAGAIFKDAMSRMVKYVRFHFESELELLKKTGYPRCAEHKKLHENLIKQILTASRDYKEGIKLVPNHFVRILKDWIFSHILIEDKIYAAYIAEQKKKGLLTDEILDNHT